MFDSVFVAVTERILLGGIDSAKISAEAFEALKNDEGFKTAITHSTSHVDSVKSRLKLTRKYLYGIQEELTSEE